MSNERLKELVERMVLAFGSGRKGSGRRYYRLKRLFDAVMQART